MKTTTNRLSDLFALEQETQCGIMRASLLELEKTPEDGAILERLMRAAHSLKGAAKLVAREDIVSAAHQLESEVVNLQRSKQIVSPEQIDLFFSLIAKIEGGPEKDDRVGAETRGAGDLYARIEMSVMDKFLRFASELLVHHSRRASQRVNPDIRQVNWNNVLGRLERLRDIDCHREIHQEISAIAEDVRLLGENWEESRLRAESHEADAFHLSHRFHREVLQARMRPLSDITPSLLNLTRNVSRELDKDVEILIANQEAHIDRDLLKQLEVPLQQLIKNSIDHGIELKSERVAAGKPSKGRISITAQQNSRTLVVSVSDDGAGISLALIREKIVARKLVTAETAERLSDAELKEFIFLPGFSIKETISDISGRGVGLDIVRENIRRLRGKIEVESDTNKGTRFTITLPLTLSLLKLLNFKVGGERYGIPLINSVAVATVSPDSIINLGGNVTMLWEGERIPIVSLASMLGLTADAGVREQRCIVVSGVKGLFGIVVDELLGQEDVVAQKLDKRLSHIPCIAAAATLSDGGVIVILDTEDLAARAEKLGGDTSHNLASDEGQGALRKKRVLVVDDSLTVRELERKILTDAGFDVSVAVDGLDGLQALHSGEFDLLITDVDMPRMNGIELIEAARTYSRTKELPIIIVSYKERLEDKKRGLEAGADGYLTKGSFQDDSFLTMVKELLVRRAQ